MRNLKNQEMDSIVAGTAVGCGVSVAVVMGAFIGLGACTAGVGAAITAVALYGTALGGLVYECSHIGKEK